MLVYQRVPPTWSAQGTRIGDMSALEALDANVKEAGGQGDSNEKRNEKCGVWGENYHKHIVLYTYKYI